MFFDFAANIKRFLQGDWTNAGMAIRYWAYAKPSAAEVLRIRKEVDNLIAESSPDAWIVKGMLIYYKLDGKQDVSGDRLREALSCFEKAAIHNKAMALQLLRVLYEQGDIGKLDYAKLVACYEKILDGNESLSSEQAIAANNLGSCYLQGFGVVQDYAVAKKYYEKAKVLGAISALSNIGLLYEYGAGVTQDYVKAMEYYEIAAQHQEASALDRLGFLYEHGLGVAADLIKAAEYYKSAACLGSVSALNHLGFFYENGWGGVTKEFAAAERCYCQAVRLGDTAAASRLVELYGKVASWCGSFLVVRLDAFAKRVLRCQQRNHITTRILSGNFSDLNFETSEFLLKNSKDAGLRTFLQLYKITHYLLQRRRINAEYDYQVRINDFWRLIACSLQTRSAFKMYAEQHPFKKKLMHSNTYFYLRSELYQIAGAATDDDFCRALQLYGHYLRFRMVQDEVPSLEREVLQKLGDSKVLPYAVGHVVSQANYCFFSDSRDSSLEEVPSEASKLRAAV